MKIKVENLLEATLYLMKLSPNLLIYFYYLDENSFNYKVFEGFKGYIFKERKWK